MNKKAKSNALLIVVIAVIVLGYLYFAGYLGPTEKTVNEHKVPADISQSQSGTGLNMKLYDKDGNEVTIPEWFKVNSAVDVGAFTVFRRQTTPTCTVSSDCSGYTAGSHIICMEGRCALGAISTMTLGMGVTNPSSSQVAFLSVAPTIVTPTAFNTALSKTPVAKLSPGQTVTFPSASMALSQWEGTTQTFNVTVSGTNEYSGVIVTASDALTLQFWAEPAGTFTVSIVTLFGVVYPIDYVSYWSFDIDTRDKTNRNNGIVYGALWNSIEGVHGSGNYNFDGINDYIDFGNDISLSGISNEITISLWIKPQPNQEFCYNGIQGNYGIAGSVNAAEGTTTWSWQLRYGSPDACSLGLQVNTVAGSKWANIGYNLNTNTWTHIASTFNGTEEKIYVNGILTDTDTFAPTTININSNNKFLLGSAGWGESNTYFKGSIDEVTVYNRALSKDEINAIYNK